MSHTAVALIMLSALVSVVQWAWFRMAQHLDIALMPVQCRGRVRWVQANSAHIQIAAATVAACGLCVLAAAAFQ